LKEMKKYMEECYQLLQQEHMPGWMK
jgi:hypothetical protein